MYSSYVSILFTHFAQFLSFCWICALHARWFFSENVLDRKDFVEKLELLLCYFAVIVVYHNTVELSDMLESICDKSLEGYCLQYLIVINIKLIKWLYTLNFT